MQEFRQRPATAQRAAPHRQPRRQFVPQLRRYGLRIFSLQIESTVANARLDQRFRMANEMEDHAAL